MCRYLFHYYPEKCYNVIFFLDLGNLKKKIYFCVHLVDGFKK